ncbi:MAG: DegT/DnrJ/EryC1/StrS family aminotransferase [Acidobacteria bacterium]|nr:DegT/DnrJ/EryC1/StrS family aminotransferase [Acidobacteriota bacterium]
MTRNEPFAGACLLGGRERELLLEVLASQSWSAFRAGIGEHDVRTLCELPSAEAANFADREAPFLGGIFVRRLEALFAARLGVRYAVACNSATSGLTMAGGALDLGPGDEVLVPCMSFHASATALVPLGVRPVFVEVDPGTFCIDPIDAASKITPRTKAIMAVHLGGVPADLDALASFGLPIIEDCAQAPGATYRGREVGSIANAGVFSLTENKTITCGEGGIVTTNDPAIALRARLIRNHGEGVVDDASLAHIVGMNFRLTDLQAALAIAQFELLDERNAARAANVEHLRNGLPRAFLPQRIEADATPAWFMLMTRYLPSPSMPSRDELVPLLHAEGIPVVGGYSRLLHQHPLFTRERPQSCPRSEQLNRELVWFPFINAPNDRADMDDVLAAVEKVLR